MSITVIITTSDGANSITRSATAQIEPFITPLPTLKSIAIQDDCERIKATIKALADGLESSSKSP